MDTPVTSVYVYPAFGSQQAVVRWDVSPEFPGERPYLFYVERSPTGTGDWQRLNQQPLDRQEFTDPSVGIFDRDFVLFYRVVMTAGEEPREYVSRPQGLFNGMHRDEFLVAREIMRRHVTQMRYRGGNKCAIFLRKKHGEVCPECTHPLAGQTVASNVCKTCFGTGISGGYHTPIITWSFIVDSQYEFKFDGEGMELQGIVGQKIQTLGFPLLSRGDYIVNIGQDQRSEIRTIERHDIRTFPILQDCGVTLAPQGDAIYRVPLPIEPEIPYVAPPVSPRNSGNYDSREAAA